MVKKSVKMLVLLLAIVPMLIFLAFVGAVHYIDFNGYKPQIEREVTQLTGRAFKIEGAIDVSLFPLVFSVGSSTLAQPANFSQTGVQARFQSLEIELDAWSLLWQRQLQVRSIELIEPVLKLMKDAQGRDNWSDFSALRALLPSHIAPLESVQSSLPITMPLSLGVAAYAETEAPIRSWRLDSLVLSKGQIQLQDESENYHVGLENWNLFALNLQPDQPFEIRTDFLYQHSESPRTVAARVTSNLDVATNLLSYRLSDWQGVLTVSLPQAHDLPPVHITTRGSVLKFDLPSQRLQVEALRLEGLNGKIQTHFTGRFGAHFDWQGELNASQLNLPLWAKHLALPIAQSADPKWQEVNGDYRWRWVNDQIELLSYTETPQRLPIDAASTEKPLPQSP